MKHKTNIFFAHMNGYQFLLIKGSKKTQCPNCGKKTFVNYIDSSIGEQLPDQYGRCDREINCAYHLNPYKDGYLKSQEVKITQHSFKKYRPQVSAPSFIPFEVLKQTRQGWEQNIFLQNLLHRIPYPIEITDLEKVIAQYDLGTVCKGYRSGSITFPFRDTKGRIRAIQVKQFDDTNHTIGTDFLHSIIEKHYKRENESLPEWLVAYLKNETKVFCLFGEHLLGKYQLNPVALVEAPKTAIYGTLYLGFPENPKNLLWLAVYNLSSLSIEKCKALQGREVYLFPDLSKDGKAFELWSNKAKELSKLIPGTRFIVSDLLESRATETEKSQGLDLADYLIKFNYKQFVKEKPQQLTTEKASIQPIEVPELKPIEEVNQLEPLEAEIYLNASKLIVPQNWDKNITQLEKYFNSITPLNKPISLTKGVTIEDIPLFIKSHLSVIKTNNGKRTFLPYLNRLQDLKQILAVI